MSPGTDQPGPPEPPGASASPDPRNIVLLGYRGCGKSRVGCALAEHLGWRFVDTDAEIERVASHTIREIFAIEGEARFRELERATVARVTAGRRQVISVGGGAVLRDENRAALRACGLCVWLTAPPEELHTRMRSDPRNAETRPALTAEGGLAEVRALLARRAPLYAATAHREVSTAGRSPSQVVADILALTGRRGGPADET